jgi:hypothetical protein
LRKSRIAITSGRPAIVFDLDSSELVFWSDQGSGDGEPDSSHTVLWAGHVERTGERP